MFHSVLVRFLSLLILLFSSQIWSHTLDKMGVSVRYLDKDVQIIANVPVQTINTLMGNTAWLVGMNGKENMSAQEIEKTALILLIENNVLLLDQDMQSPSLKDYQFKDVAQDLTAFTLGDDTKEAATYIKLVIDYAWSNIPQSIDLRYGLLTSSDPIHLQVIDEENKQLRTVDLDVNNNIIQIKSIKTITSVLDSNNTDQVKLKGVWQVGVWHVLKGADHILFILALVLVVKSFKGLLMPLTSFTLSHSLTLALIAQGFTHGVPSWLIESMIAASILMILIYECLGNRIKYLSWVTAGLGIIHGMGFAQALTDTLGDLMSWASALVKLTFAIELTQIVIAAIGIVFILLIKRYFSNQAEKCYSLSSLLIGLMASFWLIERIIPVI